MLKSTDPSSICILDLEGATLKILKFLFFHLSRVRLFYQVFFLNIHQAFSSLTYGKDKEVQLAICKQ